MTLVCNFDLRASGFWGEYFENRGEPNTFNPIILLTKGDPSSPFLTKNLTSVKASPGTWMLNRKRQGPDCPRERTTDYGPPPTVHSPHPDSSTAVQPCENRPEIARWRIASVSLSTTTRIRFVNLDPWAI